MTNAPSTNELRAGGQDLPSTWKVDVCVLVVALIVRGAVLLAMSDGLSRDPDSYRAYAENLLRWGTLGSEVYWYWNGPLDLAGYEQVPPSAYRPPLYPLLLAKVAYDLRVTPLVVATLHLVLGVGTVWLVLRLARRWGLGHYASLAALCVACDPILLNQSTQVMTETLAAFLAVLALWCLTRFDQSRDYWAAGLSGGAVALASLCRPTFLPWLVLVAAIAPLRGATWAQRCGNTASYLVVAAAVLFPWILRNYQQLDHPIVGTTHGGYTLLLGNNRYFYQYLRDGKTGEVWDARRLEANLHPVFAYSRPVDEVEADRALNRLARDEIQRDPGGFVRACFYRVGQLWGVLPHALSSPESIVNRLLRYAAAAWYVALFVAAGFGLRAVSRQLVTAPWLWGVLLCLVFTGVHTLYWSNLRMRAPLMPFVCLLAAAGWQYFVERRHATLTQSVSEGNCR